MYYGMDDWDQTDIEKRHSGKNKGVVKARSGNKASERKLILDISQREEFLKVKEYYRNQKPDLNMTSNFVDEHFPPNMDSLIYLNPSNDASKDVTEEEKELLKSFTWKRAGEVLRNHVLYDQIEIEDIHQGQIGNCYFLSAISATAEYQERFDKVFVTKTKSDNGVYLVRLVLQGIPTIIAIDDYFPTLNKWFAGASSGHKEIWVQVLEKAWAKVNRSYASTIAGLPAESFAALTEAPCVSYIHRKYPGEKVNELWKIMKDADARDYILCTNTGNNKDAEDMGLVNSHAYTIIDLYEEGELRLLKLRNPWGQFEWKGDFSDKSDKWDVHPHMKKKVGYENKDDGIFYMTFDDFLTYYPYTFICKYEKGFHYNFKKVQQDGNDCMVAAKIEITENTKIAIGLHQKQSRFYFKVPNYKPQMARIILAKYNPHSSPNYEFILSDSNNNEKQYVELDNLEPGEYHIFTNINWPYDVPCRYTLSTYASKPVDILPIDRSIIPADYLVQILGSYMNKSCKKTKMTDDAYYQVSVNDNDIGFYMVNMHNNSDSDALKVYFSSNYNHNCVFYSENAVGEREATTSTDGLLTDAFSFVLPPKSSQMLNWRLLANPWSSKIQLNQLSCNPITNFVPTVADQFKPIIDGEIRNLFKENLSLDCFYSELEVDGGVLLIFENKAKSGAYRFKVNFSLLENCRVANPKGLVFTVQPMKYQYVKLNRVNADADYNFSFKYSFKKY